VCVVSTAESPGVFSVSPQQGLLSSLADGGTNFTVSYAPVEYGKPLKGTLVVLTDEMQWSYEVCRSVHVYRYGYGYGSG